jgi:hypothetical protein
MRIGAEGRKEEINVSSYLKTYSFLKDSAFGVKNFEIRLDERGYEVGDLLFYMNGLTMKSARREHGI